MRWKHGQTIIALLCVLLLVVAAACGSGDDDDDDGGDATSTTSSTTASTSTTSASGSESTETTATEADTDATSAATATESEDEDDPTATTGSESTATEASGDEPTATTGSGSTATEPGSETPASGEADIPEFETLDPELLPNFSLTMNFNATNLSGTPETTLTMEMQQSAVDQYHFNMVTDGEALEFWTIGEQSWTSAGGEIIESPTGPLFSPADILTTGELIPEGLDAQEEGGEEVNGRQTTKWVIDGADYVQYMNDEAAASGTSTVEMTDGTGEVVVWIDDELNIMIKAEGDVAWKNSDGTDGSLIYDYEIHDIGSTAEVTAPQ